ncbi:hypothetical protein KUTeg_023602 [Tegillarca granosa]|uniref:dDENN domain-containing protein n=1 Tax=Tegillarca granosa TaxID=220873 RepID=A0ABQ9E2N7_TEGGR|nr:hypothetical protein KUTeg_023602 [Tegillarca granosa]
MISEAFLRLFVEVVGHYGEHIYTQQDNKRVFQYKSQNTSVNTKENFIKSGLSESVQQFLEWFTETQMFEVFMTDQLEGRSHEKTLELFNSRIMEYKTQELSGKETKQGQKMKCLKKLLKAS